MSSFFDTLAGYGSTLLDSAAAGVKNTAEVVVSATASTLQTAGVEALTRAASNGTVKQPAKGTDADGATVLALPAGQTVNAQGQVVNAATGMDTRTMVLIGAGLLAATLATVVIVKVLK